MKRNEANGGSQADKPHPTNGLDEVVHQRSRLGILAILCEADRVEFSYLRDALELSDGNLSRHLRTLEEAGYIEVHKGYQGRRPRTWLSLTKSGRRAFDGELAALRTLVSRLDGTPGRARTTAKPAGPRVAGRQVRHKPPSRAGEIRMSTSEAVTS